MDKELIQTVSTVIINNTKKYENIGLDITKADSKNFLDIVRLKHENVINDVTFRQLLMNEVVDGHGWEDSCAFFGIEFKNKAVEEATKRSSKLVERFAKKDLYNCYIRLQEKNSKGFPLHWICKRDAELLIKHKL